VQRADLIVTDLLQDIESEYKGETAPRSRWAVVVLTMLHPPLGYLYVGKSGAAAASAAFYLIYLVAFIGVWSLLKFFPFWPGLVFVAGWEIMAVMCLMGLLRDVELHQGQEYLLRGFNHPVVYTLVFLLTALVPVYGAYHLSTQQLWGIVQVNDDSMYPALESGDVLLVDRAAFWSREPARGEMVVLRVDDQGAQRNHVRLGRIIAEAGDEVLFEGTSVWVNGEPLQQWVYMNDADVAGTPVYIERNAERSYLIAGQATPPPDVGVEPIQVKKSQVLIIGDNRGHAMSERLFWTAERTQVLGKPIYLLYSNVPAGEGASHARFERSGLKIR